MSVRVVRLPDVGEGVAEAELVAWHVGVGDRVTSDTTVAEVLTDKATVEIYAPVAGIIMALHGEAGDVLAVGSDFFAIETGAVVDQPLQPAEEVSVAAALARTPPEGIVVTAPDAAQAKPIAAPAVRERARALGIDLADVSGSGGDGRVTHEDLDRSLQRAAPTQRGSVGREIATVTGATQTPLIGLRRKIAERMTIASSRIPHITYVDEIDMTSLEHLRRSLAATYPDQRRLTLLPFVMGALVLAIADHPYVNATFDDETGVLTTYDSVHIGIATQTDGGLVVPVVRNAQAIDVWESAQEMERVTTAARSGTAVRSELSGSTITVTSLGALGGLVTTPIINHPEVAIVGVNKMQTRPLWDGATFVPRTMMNLSSSFDHRIVDGWQAATFIQRVKALLEEPSLLFMPRPS
jgi:2-oxoisovalerate dehydrogenase E2 component (dihydrolipoyl transacylase)